MQHYPEFPGGGSYHLQGPPAPVPGIRCDARMHYSTKISPHCAKDRPNVIIIDPDYGDGDPSRWPEQDQDMTLLARPHDKHVLWRRTAGDWLAKELNLYDEVDAAYWIIDDLPKNYGLFEQVTHPKEKKEVTTGKQRLDRFVFGHNGRKIRSALSLGKHIAWLLTGGFEMCTCDGCKIVSKAGAGGGTPGQPRTSHHAHGRPRPQPKKRARASIGAPSEEGTDEDDWDGTSKRKKKKAAAAAAARRQSNRPQTMAIAEETARAAAGKGKGRAWEYDSEDDYAVDPRDIRDYEQEPAEMDDYALGGIEGLEQPYAGFDQPLTSDGGRAVNLDAHNAATDQYAQAMQAAYESDQTPEFLQQQRQDLETPSLCRVGELVWCRVPVKIEAVEPRVEGIESPKFTHWPGIVTAREVPSDANGSAFSTYGTAAPASYNVSMLAIWEEETLVGVPQVDVLPWLGFVPFAIDPKDIEDSLAETKQVLGPEVKARRSMDDIDKGGFSVLKTLWLAACEAGRYLASVQVRSLPELGTGQHLIPNPNAPPDVVGLRSLWLSRPNSRHLTHNHVYLGPELLHQGDVLRLIPNVELPPSVARHVVEKAPTQLRTSLMLQVTTFIRGGKDAPLLARGRIYEMNELSDAAAQQLDDPSTNGGLVVGQNGELQPGPAGLPADVQAEDAAALSRLPPAFPAHRWRNLAPGRQIDLLVAHVAGRFYSPGRDIQDDDNLVNVISEKARRTGVIGETGVRAVGLLLGGMVSGARVPKITAPNGVLGLAEGGSVHDCKERLRVADEQGFIAVGLYIPPPAPVMFDFGVDMSSLPPMPSDASAGGSGTLPIAPLPPTSGMMSGLPDLNAAPTAGLDGLNGAGSMNGSDHHHDHHSHHHSHLGSGGVDIPVDPAIAGLQDDHHDDIHI